jgi:hypothetical protein
VWVMFCWKKNGPPGIASNERRRAGASVDRLDLLALARCPSYDDRSRGCPQRIDAAAKMAQAFNSSNPLIIRSMVSSRSQSNSGAINRQDSGAPKKLLQKLDDAQSSEDVERLLAECPSPTAASYRFYWNLAFFVEHLVPPRDARSDETQLFIKLYERLRTRGEADQDSRARTVAAFKVANSAPK